MKKMNKSLLMSFEEYSSKLHEVPYFYFIKRSKQSLYHFGAKHTRDPHHPQFNLLLEKWQNFLDATTQTKRIVFIEGRASVDQITTLEESINNRGETGAAIFLSIQEDIPFYRPEPETKDEVTELLKEFSRDDIFYFYVSRAVGSSLRVLSSENLTKTLELKIKQYQNELQWNDFDFSLKNFEKIHQKIFNKKIDFDDKDFFIKISNPRLSETKINIITKKTSTFRNNFILSQIEKYWVEGYSIFIVYGASHVVMQEPAIRSLVE